MLLAPAGTGFQLRWCKPYQQKHPHAVGVLLGMRGRLFYPADLGGYFRATFPFNALRHEQHDGCIFMNRSRCIASHPGNLNPRGRLAPLNMLAHVDDGWLQFLNWGDGSRMRFGHDPRNSDRTGLTFQPTDETGRHVGFAELSRLQGDLAFGDAFDEPKQLSRA